MEADRVLESTIDSLALFFEDGKIQCGGFAKPRCVRGVVFEAVAGLAVDEDVKSTTVRLEPRDESVERSRIERKLAAPMRMGPDELLMHAAHRDAEKRCGGLAERACLLHRARVEVDVSMVSGKLVAGTLSHFRLLVQFGS